MSQVFPAYAGVFLRYPVHFPRPCRLPRIRGGVSRRPPRSKSGTRSSPHTRGCFRREGGGKRRRPVFPAYAGVFPAIIKAIKRPFSLPRIRGGVSSSPQVEAVSRSSSPHTRGCFLPLDSVLVGVVVFPAYAGVFLAARSAQKKAGSLPRIRGGVSAGLFVE